MLTSAFAEGMVLHWINLPFPTKHQAAAPPSALPLRLMVAISQAVDLSCASLKHAEGLVRMSVRI